MKGTIRSAIVWVIVAGSLFAQVKPPKPGFNLFSAEQDVQLGKEAASEITRKMPVVQNAETSRYLSDLGKRLAASKYAGNWPYSFQLVYDKSVNAFALPGGPTFVHTGLFAMAENEAQLAGVLAHEISHVALRHGTNQATKANLIRLPAMLAGAVAGDGILGSLAQLGIGLGANSVLLKFSRGAESEADYNGALIMADAGYNPIEMARFFEKLEAQSGKSGGLPQFLSDHPNPGNRVKAVQSILPKLPRREYKTDSGQFPRIKSVIAGLPAPKASAVTPSGQAQNPSSIRPARQLKEHRASGYSFSYPENWEVFSEGQAVTIAARAGLMRGQGDAVQVGYGVMAGFHPAQNKQLDRDTDALIDRFRQENSGMSQASQRRIRVDGYDALVTTLHSRSPFPGETEVDAVVTVIRPQGLFALVFIAPQSEFNQIQPVFEDMIRSVRFSS